MTSPASMRPFGAPHTCASCGAPFKPVVVDQALCDLCQGLAQPEPANPLENTEVAGYRLVREIGAGRFSQSWLAEDEERRPYIFKLLRRYASDPNSVQRFLAEAQRLARAPELAHPNLARPVNAGVHLVSAFFLVYESGGEHTLADELRERGRFGVARALELCAQMAEGLSALHAIGVTHLDLKPANVALSSLPDGAEQAVALDSVTAHLLARAGLDEGALPLSSAAYVSPEQARGARIGARSDLYSLGVLLFQLVSGRLPFNGTSANDLLRAHRDRAPLTLRNAGRNVHADIETLVGRLLSKDPAHRPDSAEEVAVLLRALVSVADAGDSDEEPPSAPADEVLPRSIFPTARELTPPQMLPPAVDPALEQMMMAELPPAPPDPPPGVPAWVARPPQVQLPLWLLIPSRLRIPAWLVRGVVRIRSWIARRSLIRMRPLPVAIAALAVAGLLSALVLHRAKRSAVPRGAGEDSAESDAEDTAPEVAEPAMAAATPKSASAAERELPIHKRAASPYSKIFDRAQKAIWTQKPVIAESILKQLLRNASLSRRDRARASKLMGDVEVKRGHKAKATTWYRKAFQLYDDPAERARVAKLLQG